MSGFLRNTVKIMVFQWELEQDSKEELVLLLHNSSYIPILLKLSVHNILFQHQKVNWPRSSSTHRLELDQQKE